MRMMPRVGTRKAIVSWMLLTAAVAGVAFLYAERSSEPYYQGKSLRSWLDQFVTNDNSLSQLELAQKAAAASSLQHIGTNAVPIYFQMMAARESPRKVKWLTRAEPLLARFHIPGLNAYRQQIAARNSLGAAGFVSLGTKAKPWVPVLIALTSDHDLRTRRLAMFALSQLGPTAREAWPT